VFSVQCCACSAFTETGFSAASGLESRQFNLESDFVLDFTTDFSRSFTELRKGMAALQFVFSVVHSVFSFRG
jgi:hypothetical protein